MKGNPLRGRHVSCSSEQPVPFRESFFGGFLPNLLGHRSSGGDAGGGQNQ